MASSASAPPRVLVIAGSDSGGGAGIQADLKALAASGVHGMTAVTAITAQNTIGVRSVHHVPPDQIVNQVRAVAEDIGVDAVKIGMLGTDETIRAVDEALDLLEEVPVVLDPVMVSESGAVLLDEDARTGLRDRLLPRAAVATPNLPEAAVLAGVSHEGRGSLGRWGGEAIDDAAGRREGDAEALARATHALGPGAVVVTGGHREVASDLFFDGTDLVTIEGERHPDGAAHGSGCTHSSALAAQLALGSTPLEAARVARRLAGDAVRDGLRDIGSGPGPVDVLGVGRRAGHGREDRGRASDALT